MRPFRTKFATGPVIIIRAGIKSSPDYFCIALNFVDLVILILVFLVVLATLGTVDRTLPNGCFIHHEQAAGFSTARPQATCMFNFTSSPCMGTHHCHTPRGSCRSRTNGTLVGLPES